MSVSPADIKAKTLAPLQSLLRGLAASRHLAVQTKHNAISVARKRGSGQNEHLDTIVVEIRTDFNDAGEYGYLVLTHTSTWRYRASQDMTTMLGISGTPEHLAQAILLMLGVL